MSVILRDIEDAVEGVLGQESVELVDLNYLQENGRWVLRFFIDKEGGVTISDCENLSKRIGALLDATEMIPHKYALEVSSPGLNRILKKEKDFQRFSGERVKVRVRAPIDGQRRFRGTLKGVEDGGVLVEHEGGTLKFQFGSIEEARLDPDIKI
jgi:ribosome maturation factor RimP